MSPDERDRKVAMIRGLETIEEVRAWRAQLAVLPDRPFEGEIAELVQRERDLGRAGRGRSRS